jgi:DNA-binding transcriptional ArsR family regulator
MSAAIDRTFSALADPHRRKAIELLGERPRRAGELAQLLDLSPPAMSRHLRALREANLVEEWSPDFDTRVRVYSLKDGAIDGLKAWLGQTETLWADQLARFKAHIEIQ